MAASDLLVSLHFDFLVAAANDGDNVVKTREARQSAYMHVIKWNICNILYLRPSIFTKMNDENCVLWLK